MKMRQARSPSVHQSLTFSRRCCCSAAPRPRSARCCRAHGLDLDRREPALPAAGGEQSRPDDPGPAAPRLDRRPLRQADRDQPRRRPHRHHPRPARGRRKQPLTSSPSCSSCRRGGAADPRGSEQRPRLPAGAGRRACHRPSNIPRSRCASPNCPASRRRAASPVTIPKGRRSAIWSAMSACPIAKEYEAEDQNPLLITPGFKVGKEGLEKMLEDQPARHARRAARRGDRARPAGARARPLPDRAAHRPADDRRRPAAMRRGGGRPIAAPWW